ncbi:TIGR02646 family protein [Aeromonas veronii]|uniref:retron Ec78 anti-phage system effector HNH endonuclease PtuB n=1 Tax=Aeromonas TaxID=642 RepID=UPI001C5BBEED|nr:MULTISPECIES: retron Ec78 anti-phage system effector HNH endonuclease PtuB [Aeromonas]MBW3782086.1 TIGR02646 family protein [Aeromonas veronii]MCF3097924.1 TIGR02646 family protein [Aeromonas australiensis]
MHKLNRGPVPVCLSRFQHGRDNWGNVASADKQDIWLELVAMQGERCAYCEADISSDGKRHIEHFRQKGRDPTQTFVWQNLFGSCGNTNTCGTHKDKQGIYPPAVLLKPDQDDPDHFLRFHSDGSISILSGLSDADQQRASETLRLFNLTDGSLRWQRQAAAAGYRQTAEEIAELAAVDLELAATYLADEIAATSQLPFATAIKHTLQNA